MNNKNAASVPTLHKTMNSIEFDWYVSPDN
jgi:hypothetical protein